MNISTVYITLDLEKTTSNAVVNLHQGSTAVEIRIALTEGIEPYALDGVSLAVFGTIKPDGTEIANACTLEDGFVVYSVSEQTVALIGTLDCQIRLYGVDGLIGVSPPFTVIVYPATVNYSDIESTDEYSALDEMLKRASEQFEAYQLPHIGDNGNWWIGESDTGVRATGEKGDAYVLTETDKQEIVDGVLSSFTDASEVAM